MKIKNVIKKIKGRLRNNLIVIKKKIVWQLRLRVEKNVGYLYIQVTTRRESILSYLVTFHDSTFSTNTLVQTNQVLCLDVKHNPSGKGCVYAKFDQ